MLPSFLFIYIMIVFEELRITNDGETLVVKARVRTEIYYDTVYIDKVIIDTEETYKEGFPSSTPVFTYTADGNVKSITLAINKAQIIPDFKEHLFFVYVVTKGNPLPSVPCGMDNQTTLGVTMYMGNIYNNFMGYIKEMGGGNCQVPKGLIDQILRFKALTISMDSGQYLQGIDYYNKWFSGKRQDVVTIPNCGCNG